MNLLKIYIDRLREGEKYKIDESLPLVLLETEEEELSFKGPVQIRLTAYLAEDHLILHFDAEATASLPCSICNLNVEVPIKIHNHYSTKPLSEIKGSIYDCTDEIRETILLHVPLFAECRPEGCPERENLKKFISTQQNQSKDYPGDQTHFPFADL